MKRYLIVMLFLFPQLGCAHHAKEQIPILRTDVERGGRTAVFLRFRPAEGSLGACTDELLPLSRFAHHNIRLWSLSTGKQVPVKEVLYSLPAEQAGKDWVVILLESGSYYLRFELWGGTQWEKQAYFLGVPETPSGVYAGSFYLECSEDRKGHQTYRNLTVVDERVAADGIIRASLGGKPGLPCPVTPYGQLPDSRRVPEVMALKFREKVPLQTPEWKKRSVFKALGGGEGARQQVKSKTATPLEVAGQALSVTPGAIVIPMAYLAYVPFGSTYGLVKGSLNEMKYGGCMQELVREMERQDLMQEARRFIEASRPADSAKVLAADPYQAEAASGNGRLGGIELKRVQLRECLGDMSFCLEVAALAQIWDVAERRNVFAEMLVYRHPFSLLSGEAPYEIDIEQASGCRPIASYCGDAGNNILREELTQAIGHLINRALRDFGGSQTDQQSEPGGDNGNIPHNDRGVQ